MKRVLMWCGLLALLVGASAFGQQASSAGAAGGGSTQLVTMLVTFRLIVAVPLGLIPANIAKGKGRKFGTWFIYGIFLFWVALIHSIAIKNMNRKCPYCAEYIKQEAKVCRYCGRDVVPTA